jgi:hypothetical protein
MIIIAGDSWAVGEWSADSTITGPGFGNYLSLDNFVINTAMGGHSNTESLDKLEYLLNELIKRPTREFDYFFWVVSNPLRCLSNKELKKVDDLEQVIANALHTSLDRANRLADKYKFKLHLLGGLCDLDNINVTRYPNLDIFIPSIAGLSIEKYPTSIHSESYRWADIAPLVKSNFNQWDSITTVAREKETYWDNSSLMVADHPSREIHFKIAKEINEKIIHP